MDKDYDVIPKSQHPADMRTFAEQMADLEEEINQFQKKEVAALAVFAHFFGWRKANAKGLVITPPDGGKAVSLPMTGGSINIKVFRSTANAIVRHGQRDSNVPLYLLVDNIIDTAKLSHDHARALRQAADTYQGLASSRSQSKERTEIDFDAEVDPPPPPKVVAPRITKVEQWTAHSRPRKDGVETYPSEAVMEVTWSDGTVSYSCSDEECEYTSPYPRSVASHYASKHRRGKGNAPQPEADGVDSEWTPTQATRIRRLKRELDGALASGLDITDTEAVAAWIITHRIEGLAGSEGDGDTSVPAEPLTAEQILDKIAALADRGRAHILREQLETLNALLDESEAQRQTEAQRRERAEGSLSALRELINETGEQ